MLKKVLFVIIFLFFFKNYSQQVNLSLFSEISIITTGPGDALYEKFGHTAIRVKDPVLNLDLIYNYGIFDFDDPNFYLNFIKGNMKYKLVKYPFYYSVSKANDNNRWMTQQVLNLTEIEKNNFFKFLEVNCLPQNASYLYDPFFNNCATKPKDIINKILKNKVIWSDNHNLVMSIRQLMNNQINQNTWGSVGINIALGSKIDKKAISSEYLFLPDYVKKNLNDSKIKRDNKKVNLVSKNIKILNFKEKKSISDKINPLLIFLLLLFITIFITFKSYKNPNYKKIKYFDFLLMLISGLVGIVIVFLWFFTNHSTTQYNYNLLWAFPTNFFISFYFLKKRKPKWFKLYIKIILFFLLLVPIVWISKIQLFNWTLIPFFIILLIRYFFLKKTLNS